MFKLGLGLLLLTLISLAAPGADSRVADAAMNGDRAALTLLLQQKVPVNAPQPDGTTALHWAVRRSDLAAVDVLLKNGADVKAATRYGITPLHLAAANGDAGLLSRLIAAGADPNSANPAGETTLMTAVRAGKTDALKVLIERGAEVNARESQRQQTALMWAAAEGQLPAVKVLLEHGADVNAQSSVYTPEGEYVPPRPGQGAAPGLTRQRVAPTPTGKMTALLFAARQGHVEIVQVLLDAGADINLASANHTTPMLIAILNGNLKTAMYLLEKGANPNLIDDYSRGPLFATVEIQNFNHEHYPDLKMDGGDPSELISALLARGANVNQRTKTVPVRGFMQSESSYIKFDGQTPFLRAALSGDVKLMRYLLEHGADPNIATELGTTPLLAAAGVNYVVNQTYIHSQEEHLEAIKLCLEQGNDILAANSEGFTVMHGAAIRGWESAIRLLSERGASLDAKDKEGRTPMTFAEGTFVAAHAAEVKPGTIALLKELLAKRAAVATK